MDNELIIKNNELAKYTNCDDMTWEFAYKIIKIPDGVTKICKEAFRGACDIKGVVIPSSVKTIEKHAFYHCLGLEVVLMEEGVETIAEGAFDSCHGLKELYIPRSIKTIRKASFMGCESIEQLIIPMGVFELQDYCFGFCNSLKQVYLSNSAEFIVKGSLMECGKPQILGEPGTAAELFADENGLEFIKISQTEIDEIHSSLYNTCKEKTAARVLYSEDDTFWATESYMKRVKAYEEA